jgi:hypothetical protein
MMKTTALLLLSLFSHIFISTAEIPTIQIKVDQVGYLSSTANEIAINWNAPLVFMLAGVVAGGCSPIVGIQLLRVQRMVH